MADAEFVRQVQRTAWLLFITGLPISRSRSSIASIIRVFVQLRK